MIRGVILLMLVLAVAGDASAANDTSPAVPLTAMDTQYTLVHSKDYPPLFYIDESGASVGILVDYWKLWSQKTGISIRFEPMLWHQCIERGKTDDQVIIPGLFYSPERDAFLDFSAAFFDVKNSLFLRKSIQATVLEDLRGRVVGVAKGDRVVTLIQNHMPYLKLELYDGFEDVMKSAVNGRVDAFAMDNLCAKYYLHKYEALDRFIAFKTLYIGKFCAGVKEGNYKLLNLIDDGIVKVRQDEVDKILENWLFTKEFVSKKVLKVFIGVGVAVFFIIILVSAVVLKLQVQRRTRDLQLANRDLEESQARFRRLNETFQVGLVIHVEGMIKEVNVVAANMVGYSVEELIGINGLDIFSPESREEVFHKVKTDYDQPYEAIMVRRNGTTFPVEIRGKQMPYKGRMARVSEFRDISTRKQAQKEKQELEERIQRMEKMEALGTLAGGVAHDLNNILSGLVSYPELLLLDLPPESRLRKPIETIQRSGHKAAAIVQDLLTLARRGLPVMDVLNMNQIISEYLHSPEHQKVITTYPDLRITADLDSRLLNIVGSLAHLSKAIMNIVLNAAEAMPDGGHVTITTRNQYIDTSLNKYEVMAEGDYAVLTITDTGPGISQEDQGRIFEPFYTKKKMGRSGTGLGMAVVWGTIQDHQGYIDIDSKEGVGTSFMLYFPATREPLSVPAVEPHIERFVGNGERILVVDDVPEQRDIATQLLTRLGYEVHSVSSGEEAVAFLEEESVDLVILDMIMSPGIDGLETYRQIREVRPGQKAIIASGFSETDRVHGALELGVGRYIKKPYTLEQIGDAVKKELAGDA